MVQPNPTVVSDFSNLPPYYGSSPFGSAYVLVGDRYEQAPNITSIYAVDAKAMPKTFPIQQWFDQSGRYVSYWAWFNGDIISQAKQEADGSIYFRFPLRINPIRDITRKHASVLFGEAPDGPEPLVQAAVRAVNGVSGDKPNEDQQSFALLCKNIINKVWMQSNGRAIQLEGGEISQFLGGHAYQVAYESWRTDLKIPLSIRSWKADFFMPVWDNGDYWNLSQVYVVNRIEGAIAKSQYGIDVSGAFVYYVEQWGKDFYSVFINNQPIKRVINGIEVTFENLPNPFGFVPFVYIPHLREGSFYGSSHVVDVQGLIQEYNSALADQGDAVKDMIDRTTYVSNSSQRTAIELPNGKKAINLGMQNPSVHNAPTAFAINPPSLSPGMSDYPDKVYDQMRRSGFMPAVAEGEDEGSQRSGTTLDIRFWPATAHAKSERTNWETGLDLLDIMILKMVHQLGLWKKLKPGMSDVADDFIDDLKISQEWHPQLPRDRPAEVNEYLSRLNGGAMSIELFLEKIGDVPDVDVEKQRIMDWMEFKSQLAKPAQADPGDASPLTNAYSKQNEAIDTQQ